MSAQELQSSNSTTDWAAAVNMHSKDAKSVNSVSDSMQNASISDSGDKLTMNNGEQDSRPEAADESLLNKMLNDKLKYLNNVSLDVQQKDPSSPLFAAKSFTDLPLSEELKKALRDMRYERPSKIQETALPLMLSAPYDNMIAQSQSGTGKTAAFSLTVLSRLNLKNRYPQALILAPTYELALQIGLTVQRMGQFMLESAGLQQNDLIAYATRGNDPMKGTQIPNPVIIGTPGTVLKWAKMLRSFDTKKIEIVVFDEADVMIAKAGHKDETIKIKRMLGNKDLQSLLFSATYEENVLKFAKSIIKEANIITLRREEETIDNIRQFYVATPNDSAKISALRNIYGVIGAGQAVIFCKRRDTARQLAHTLHNHGHSCAVLSGELDISQRATVIRDFRSGKQKVLISTNVVARGIDVEQVTFVVNYDLPDKKDEDTGRLEADPETYLHRIGRTGRFGKTGIAVNFLANQKDNQMMRAIQQHFGKPIDSLDATDMDEMEEKLG